MKVILLQNVPNLGQKDEVKEVKTGYWRNFLLPNNLGVLATPKLLEQAEKRREEAAKQEETENKKIAKDLEKIKDKILVIKTKADEKGNLFAGINTKDISELIKKETKVDIASEFIEIEKPIKEIGIHEVPVKGFILKIEVKPE